MTMNSIRITILVFIMMLWTGFIALAEEAPSQSNNSDIGGLRWFLGGKLGYSGININSISNKTVGKPSNAYSTFLSTFGFGPFGGLQYMVLPSFGIRAELEYLYRLEVKTRKHNGYRYLTGQPNNFTHQDASAKTELSLETHTILANMYLDYYITPRISLYVGAGIGASIIESSIDAPSYSQYDDIPEPDGEKNSINFAWQAGLGSRFFITDHVTIDINARYVGLTLSKTTLGSPQLLRMKYGMVGSAEVLAGVSYVF